MRRILIATLWVAGLIVFSFAAVVASHHEPQRAHAPPPRTAS
jgi:hypothetical protein